MRIRRIALAAGAWALVASGCGGADTAAPAQAEEVEATTTTAGEGAAAPTTTAAPPTTTTSTPPPTTSSSTTTSTTVPIDTLPALDESLGEASGEGRALAAGSYRSTSLTPPVRYDIADDMAAFVLEDSLDSFGPFGYENLADPTITFVEFAGLPEPAKVPKHEHPTDPPLVAIESDADLDGFFSDTPGLVLLDSGADDAGSWWDFTAHTTEGNGYTCPYGDNCFNIAFVDELGYFIMGEDWTARLWRIEGESGVIYAWLQALNDDFDEGLAFATPVMDGLTVG